MKKAAYYENTLEDLKKEQGRETRVIKSLKDIRTQLECQGYQPLDPLEGVIKDLESRRNTVRGAVKRLEELVK